MFLKLVLIYARKRFIKAPYLTVIIIRRKRRLFMEVRYYSILSRAGYEIPCKLFSKGRQCRAVIIGLHGFGGSKESFALTLLAEKMPDDYKLIAFDFPAHGSGADDCFLTLKNCQSDLQSVCNHAVKLFSGADIYIFATSFGGFIWLNSEKKLKGVVSKAVLRVPAVEMEKTLAERLLPISFEEFQKQGYAICGYDRKFKVSYDFYCELVRNSTSALSPALPTLMICGDKDELVDYNAQLSFAKRNKDNVRLITIENAGHRFQGDGELEKAIAAAVDFIA